MKIFLFAQFDYPKIKTIPYIYIYIMHTPHIHINISKSIFFSL